MNISTKKGDQGYTDIKGQRVKKSAEIIETLGVIDETVALIILADSYQEIPLCQQICANLSCVASDIAGYGSHFDENLIQKLEEIINNKDEHFTFTYPFKDTGKAYINYARSQVRTLERQLYRLENINENYYKFLNRLSDYLYIQIL